MSVATEPLPDYVHRCGGEWKPVLGWHARYRCDKCGVFGSRRKMVEGFRGEHIAMVHCRKARYEALDGPLRPGEKRPRARVPCGNGAVGKPVVRFPGQKEWRCREHWPK